VDSDYTTLEVQIEVYSTQDGGVSYAYEDIVNSPFTVEVGIVDWDYYFSYEDILNNGFGVTSSSFLDAIPTPVAGVDFSFTIDSRNNFD
jgi:hypothetical protein